MGIVILKSYIEPIKGRLSGCFPTVFTAAHDHTQKHASIITVEHILL